MLGLHYLNLQVGARLNGCAPHNEGQLARSIGALLRSLRKRRGFSQSQLAMRAAGCIARTYLSKAECGHVLLPLDKLVPIAKALGLTAVILRFESTTPVGARQANDRH
jgi:transcriptional regulator with XRE-family HTH domain